MVMAWLRNGYGVACGIDFQAPEKSHPHETAAESSQGGWELLPDELLQQIAALALAAPCEDYAASLRNRNNMRLVCRAWREACAVRLRPIHRLPQRGWRHDSTQLCKLIASLQPLTLARYTVPRRAIMLATLPTEKVCASIASFEQRLGRRGRSKLDKRLFRLAAGWRQQLQFPAGTVTLDLRWSVVLVDDSLDPFHNAADTKTPQHPHQGSLQVWCDTRVCKMLYCRGSLTCADRKHGLAGAPLDVTQWLGATDRMSSNARLLGQSPSLEALHASCSQFFPGGFRRGLASWSDRYAAKLLQGILPLGISQLEALTCRLRYLKSITVPVLSKMTFEQPPGSMLETLSRWRGRDAPSGPNIVVSHMEVVDPIFSWCLGRGSK